MAIGVSLRLSRAMLFVCAFCFVVLLYAPSTMAKSANLDWSGVSSDEVERIRAMLDEQQIEKRLSAFVDRSLLLKKEVLIVVYPGFELFLDTASGISYLPFQMLRQLEASITERYARQAVRQKIFAAAVEHLLWVQLGKALVSQFSLPIQGEPAYALDGFATVMLLNLHDSAYLLDATEEYLLVDQTGEALVSGEGKSELEFDKSRYQLIVCTVVGKDFDKFQNSQPELAWAPARRAQCERRYQAQISEWYAALQPYLKPENRIRYWLPQQPSDFLEEGSN